MATVPDVILLGNAYQDVYAATSIAVGTAVKLQNKSSTPILLQIITAQPAVSSSNGFIIPPLGFFDVPTSTTGLWAKGNGALAVA